MLGLLIWNALVIILFVTGVYSVVHPDRWPPGARLGSLPPPERMRMIGWTLIALGVVTLVFEISMISINGIDGSGHRQSSRPATQFRPLRFSVEPTTATGDLWVELNDSRRLPHLAASATPDAVAAAIAQDTEGPAVSMDAQGCGMEGREVRDALGLYPGTAFADYVYVSAPGDVTTQTLALRRTPTVLVVLEHNGISALYVARKAHGRWEYQAIAEGTDHVSGLQALRTVSASASAIVVYPQPGEISWLAAIRGSDLLAVTPVNLISAGYSYRAGAQSLNMATAYPPDTLLAPVAISLRPPKSTTETGAPGK